MKEKTITYWETYYDDAERLAKYLSEREKMPIEIISRSVADYPTPKMLKPIQQQPTKLNFNLFKVGNYEIIYTTHRKSPTEDRKHRNRTLYRVMLGEHLRKARTDKGITLDEVAQATGLKANNIDNIEKGRYDASIDILGNIAEALGLELTFKPSIC